MDLDSKTTDVRVFATRGCEFEYARGRIAVPDLELRAGEAALIELPRAEVDRIHTPEGERYDGGADEVCEVLLGLAPAVSGEVRLFGEDVLQAPRSRQLALRRRVALALERPAFLSTVTVPDNVALPLRDRRDPPDGDAISRTLELLERFGLEVRGRVLPSQLTREARYLAGVARALLVEAELLLIAAPESPLSSPLAQVWCGALEAQRARGAALLVLGGPSERRVLPFGSIQQVRALPSAALGG